MKRADNCKAGNHNRADSNLSREWPSRLGLVSTFIMLVVIIIMTVFLVSAAPPTPKGISGYIYFSDGITQVPLGTSYYINDTTSGFFVQDVTSLPIPGNSGYYSKTIQGNNGDNVTVRAWNQSHYGETNVTIQGNTKGVNVTINILRGAEPAVNITSPPGDSVKNDSAYFTVLSNLTLYGADGTGCNATVSYSNTSVLQSYNNQPTTINYGNLSRGWTTIVTWNISGISVGSSNVTVNFTCSNEAALKFEDLKNTDTVFNISINDTTPPVINLMYPQNDTTIGAGLITFQYNVSDISNLTNCSLYLNGALNQTNNSPQTDITLNFAQTLGSGQHNWSVACYDSNGLRGVSLNYTFLISGITVQTDKQNYLQGETVQITGVGWNDGNVTIIVYIPGGGTDSWNTTASSGSISTNYFINYSSPTGLYNITAYEALNQSNNATTNFTVIQRTPLLTTDQTNYNYNEIAIISGFNFSINATINLTIFQNSTGKTGLGFPNILFANYSGNFVFSWNVTDTCTGVYVVRAKDLNWTPYDETAYFNITNGVNCTDWNNTAPNITTIEVDDILGVPVDEIDLLAGQLKEVYCSIIVYDADGFDDVTGANATFFYYQNTTDDPDDNNTHYTQTSCTDDGNDGANEQYYICEFNVTYYANNGTWYCNATAYDTQKYHNDSAVDSTYMNELYALNLTPLIDFGDVPTGSISAEVSSLVTNIGNVEMDVGIDAYGVVDSDGIAMNCTQNNISLNDERYDINTGTAFNLMTPVTDTMVNITGFNLVKQTNSTTSQKNLYWRTRATPPSFGDCQGVVVFTAVGT